MERKPGGEMRSFWAGRIESSRLCSRDDEPGTGRGLSHIFLGVCLLLAVGSLQLAGTAAAAPGNHVFSPLLSLTGGPATPPLDDIPDPGSTHPSTVFGVVCGVAVDLAGNTYVGTKGEYDEATGETKNGHIDIFDPEGHFLLEIVNDHRPCDMAVDSEGELYVVQADPESGFHGVVRYSPNEYPPTPTTDYGSPTFVEEEAGVLGLAVNQENDHVFVPHGTEVVEYSSASTGNAFIRSIGEGTVNAVHGVAVDASTGKIFVASVCQGCPFIHNSSFPFVSVVDVFDASGTLIETIDGSDVPGGGFTSDFGKLSLAVDEESGELFVHNTEPGNGAPRLYRFVFEGGSYHWVADPELEEHSYKPENKVAVSNGPSASTRGNVYVTSQGQNGPAHMYAFLPAGEVGAPLVANSFFDNPATEEAELGTELNPNGAATRYTFEYVEAAVYDEDVELSGASHGFDHGTIAKTGELSVGNQFVPVSTVVTGLVPGTSYRFRVTAENCVEGELRPCEAEGEAVLFATYPSGPPTGPCPNKSLRVGLSAALPDCRAYELVTPPNTNGRGPLAAYIGFAPTAGFPVELATPDGSSLLFMTNGGSLPIAGGNGVQDGYEAVRGLSGWEVRAEGPSGAQSQTPLAGGASPDHGFWFWMTGGVNDHGSLVVGGKDTTYVRYPDGSFHLVGEGVLNDDPGAKAHSISFGGSHTIISATIPLIEGASPAGTRTIYDRRSDGSLDVVSLEPSGEAPGAGAEVFFQGSDDAGTAVAFTVVSGGTTSLFLRDSAAATTALIASTAGKIEFAGLSADGRLLTYVKGGDLFSYDAASGISTKIGFGGQSTPVNVSADGSHVYFVSPKVLMVGGPSNGGQNFYVWDSQTGSSAFIGQLTTLDVEGESGAYGLGRWLEGVNATGISGPALDPSRTTPDGRVLVFESHANLTGYDSDGHSEIYMYVAGEEPSLSCLSCSPALLDAGSDAHLQVPIGADPLAVTNGQVPIHNVTSDGRTVFFQTGDALVPDDVDQVDDVYEWSAMGPGGCNVPAGCLALISSGHSSADNYLFAATPDGHDVFFSTGDQLLGADTDPTASIYDARIGGGFPEPAVDPCEGEGCKAQPESPPPLAGPGSTATGESGNVKPGKHCKKGQKKVRRGGRVKCVARHKKRHHHQKKRRHADTHSGGAR
jgi:hypothetical protein